MIDGHYTCESRCNSAVNTSEPGHPVREAHPDGAGLAPIKKRATEGRKTKSYVPVSKDGGRSTSETPEFNAAVHNSTQGHVESGNQLPSALGREAAVKVVETKSLAPPLDKSTLADKDLNTKGSKPKLRAQASHALKPSDGVPASTNTDGQAFSESHFRSAVSEIGGGHRPLDAQDENAAADPLLAEIRALHRHLRRWHKAKMALTLQAKAHCRAWFDGDKEAANKTFDVHIKGGDVDPHLAMALVPYLSSIQAFDADMEKLDKRLKKIVRQLPVWPWCEAQKGFAEGTLGKIVGEAGDLGSFATVSKVWKFFGLAVIDGKRQRKVADAEEAMRQAYNPERRSMVWHIGECFVKSGKGEDASPWRKLYDQRKAYEMLPPEERLKAWVEELAKQEGRVPQASDGRPTPTQLTPAQANARAKRYVTKKFLAALWGEWRKASGQRSTDAHSISAVRQAGDGHTMYEARVAAAVPAILEAAE